VEGREEKVALPFFLFKKQVIKYISIGVLINKNYLKKLKLNLVYFFIDYITQKKIEIKFFILPYSIHSLPVATLQIASSRWVRVCFQRIFV
jgi:hypothetical protein